MCHLNPVSIFECLAGYGVTQSVRVMTRSPRRCGAKFGLLTDLSGAGSIPAIVAIFKKTEIKMNKQMIAVAIMASVGEAYRPSILDYCHDPIKKSKKPSGAAKARRAKKKGK